MKASRFHWLVCAVWLISVGSVWAADAGPDYYFVREFGTGGTAPNQFFEMDGIAVDRFGHVFVTDNLPPNTSPSQQGAGMAMGILTNLGVKRWTAEGAYELMWTSSVTYLQWPASGIDCSCDGDPFYVAPVYIISPFGANIEHTDPVGHMLESFPFWLSNTIGFYFRDVAVSGNGDVYGILYGQVPRTNIPLMQAHVARFVWTGTAWSNTVVVSIAPELKLSGMAWGIDVDAWRERVYVSILAGPDGAGGVKVYDLELNPVIAFDLWGYDARPLGVAVDNRDGSIFVCEAVSNMIYKYDTGGNLMTSWGGPGSTPSLFNRPSDIDVDMDGWVFVADADNHRVQVFAPYGDGNLNFIVDKANVVVRWKQRLRGKTNDTIVVRAIAAIDAYTNITTLAGLPFSFSFGAVKIIPEMLPTKVNRKGTRATFKPDKNHKMTVVYRPEGALLKMSGMIKKADIPGPLGISDIAVLPPWLWARAQMTLTSDYLGVHYMRLLHKNKPGKIYKAWKK
jgi:DNA-binding beta-propeller fold protein YncE